jgi:hypothetical protein
MRPGFSSFHRTQGQADTLEAVRGRKIVIYIAVLALRGITPGGQGNRAGLTQPASQGGCAGDGTHAA